MPRLWTAFIVPLVAAYAMSAVGMEASIENVPVEGGPATISPASPTIVVELKAQEPDRTVDPETQVSVSAESIGGDVAALGAVEISQASTGTGTVQYLSIDASPLCAQPGVFWIVTANVDLGSRFSYPTAAVSRLVICQP